MPPKLRLLVAFTALGVATLFAGRTPAQAQPSSCVPPSAAGQLTTTPNYLWTYTNPAPAIASIGGSGGLDSGRTFITTDTTLTALWSETAAAHVGATLSWTRSFAPATITATSGPIELSDGAGKVIFLALSDDRIYKIDVATGATLATSANLGRAGCTADRIVAPPFVQLRAKSDLSFQSTYATDVVFVVTRFRDDGVCLPNQNRLIALSASTLSTLWLFNLTGTSVVGEGTGSCQADYGRHRLFFGTAEAGPLSNTLYCFNSVTHARDWSVAAGPILNRPVVTLTRIYTAGNDGAVRAFDAATGSPTWSPLLLSAPVASNPLYIPSGSGQLLVTDIAGTLHGIVEMGTNGAEYQATTMSAGVATAPVGTADGTRAYVVLRDNTLVAFDTATFIQLSCVNISEEVGGFVDPVLDYPDFNVSLDRLNVAVGTTVRRLCIRKLDDWSCTTTAVAEEPAPGAPRAFLGPNAPNPFHPGTRIEFGVPVAGRVSLRVYDVNGRLVRELLNGEVTAGARSVQWDGADRGGRAVASGAYWVDMRAGAFRDRRLMVLVK